ncbi:tRNA (N6-threonylcarbamoyladenosine(37)-N6)-methyltransferase TrmO, partial [candidate division WOR-3 bacterium]
MTAGEISFKPIGIIHTPFKEPEGTPIQPKAGEGVEGYVEIFPEYVDGLKDLDGFSHIILIYYFHLSRPYRLKVTPFM